MRERLYRSRGDRMLFGVAGGLARYLGLDPSIVRLVWALLVLAGGAGIVLYIVAAIVIPEEPVGGTHAAAPESEASTGFTTGSRVGRSGPTNAPILVGVALVAVGAWLLAERLLPGFDGRLVWPALLIVLGFVMLAGAMRGRSDQG